MEVKERFEYFARGAVALASGALSGLLAIEVLATTPVPSSAVAAVGSIAAASVALTTYELWPTLDHSTESAE